MSILVIMAGAVTAERIAALFRPRHKSPHRRKHSILKIETI